MLFVLKKVSILHILDSICIQLPAEISFHFACNRVIQVICILPQEPEVELDSEARQECCYH